MLQLREKIYNSLVSTSRHPRWWILAFLQIAALSAMGKFSKPYLLDTPYFLWLILAILVLQPVIAWLWLDIEAQSEGKVKRASVRGLLMACLRSLAITFAAEVFLMISRAIIFDWTFLALISSLVAATSTLAILYVILCQQPFYKAWALALDTWHKKISLAAASAVVLIFAHGISYVLVHTVWAGIFSKGEFSAFNHSATIWVLSAVLCFAVAYLGAVLNCFLVFLFLDIIRRQKEPEIVENQVPKLEALKANS